MSENFLADIYTIFGNDFNLVTLEKLHQQWENSKFDDFPEIEIRSSAEINGANGAFSVDTNKIYLSKEFLIQNNSEAITNLLLEEYGHYIDSQIKFKDTPGDEGAIFSAVVRGEDLNDRTLQQLRHEDDSAVVNIDGEEVAIEQNLLDTVLYSNRIDLDDYNFNFKTADYINRWTGSKLKNEDNRKNNFTTKLPWGSNRFNLLGGSFGPVGASAGIGLAPGFVEAGFEVEAGYNLGQFDVSLPFSAGVEAAFVNNQLTVDVDANFQAPQFNYTLPYVYANLGAVLGYDINVDIFGEAFADIGFSVFGKKISKRYSTGASFDLASAKGRTKKRLVQLDTRRDDNFIDLIYKKISLGNKKEDSVSRSETNGFLGLDFELPSFNGSFKPLAGNEFNPISGLDEVDSASGLSNEYLWEFKEEKKLVDADFAIDNLLAQIPFLSWLSKAGNAKFSVAGYDVGLEYDWRTIALDLSTSLNYGYSFKTGFGDLLPKINRDKSEIASLIDSGKSTIDQLTFNSYTDKKTLVDKLVAADERKDDGTGGDGDINIDIVVEFNPKVIFDAEVYLKPEVALEWDIGVVKGKLAPVVNNLQEFTLIPGKKENIFSDKIPIVAPTRQEVSFKDFYGWLKQTNPSLPDINTEYSIEIPFSAIDPDRFPGTKGDDYIVGKDGDEGEKFLGDGNDIWVFSTGKDGEINGGNGFDTLKIVTPETYTLTANTLADSNNNVTTFTSFSSVEIDGTQSTTLEINISGNLNEEVVPYVFGATTDFSDRVENLDIHHLDTQAGDDIVTGNLYNRFGEGAKLITGLGNDEITVSSTTLPNETTRINAGAGDDKVNFTIIPYYVSDTYQSRFEIDLDTGKDSLKVIEATPIGGTSGLLPEGELLVTGYIGGKTIDLELNADNFSSELALKVRASAIRDLFGLETDADIDRLFIEVANSEINYKLDNTNPDATQIQDKIVKADKIKLVLTDSQIASEITINPQDFVGANLTIDGNGDLTEILIDTDKLGDIATIPDVEANDVSSIKLNSVNADFLKNKLLGDFRTLDFSDIVTGVSLDEDFLSDSNNLDIDELVFTDAKDTIYFSPDASKVTSEGTNFNEELEGSEQLMSFNLGAGDDIFHDRTGFKNSSIFPGLGNDFIYGEGGFDEVFYDEGSRFDYNITVVDDRTVEVLYKPDNTIDTLVDVERINFARADELVKNPYYQGPDIDDLGYTTFTLQVSKSDGWQQPPFVFAPFTYFVPFGTTEVTLTEDFLLTNVYDPEGNEDQLEISFIDLYTNGNFDPQLDTDNPDADVWQVSIPGGLNEATEYVEVVTMVDNASGSSQGNELEIYPSTELSYPYATAPIDLVAFDKSESIEATEFDDTISSGGGDDTLEGNLGNDLLNGEAGNDSLDGAEGNDAIAGGAGNDNILGRLGDDFLEGNEGEDILEGDAGSDTLNGGGDLDLLLGGDGDDVYISQIDESAGDIIQDTQGNDTIQLLNSADTEAIITLSQPVSGTIGISRQKNDLFIDLNQDGVINVEEDLNILDYFNESGAGAGNGFIENVANLSGNDILNFLPPDEDGNNIKPSSVTDNDFTLNQGDISGEDSNDNKNLGSTVYRFYNQTAGVHFYTNNEAERDFVQNELSNYSFEGPSYTSADPSSDTSESVAVYRFFNTATGVHLYTTKEKERDFVREELSSFNYEGEAFFAYETEVEGSIPIYRFFNIVTGAHFYTPSAGERDVVEDNLPDFQPEGIAYYAFPVD